MYDGISQEDTVCMHSSAAEANNFEGRNEDAQELNVLEQQARAAIEANVSVSDSLQHVLALPDTKLRLRSLKTLLQGIEHDRILEGYPIALLHRPRAARIIRGTREQFETCFARADNMSKGWIESARAHPATRGMHFEHVEAKLTKLAQRTALEEGLYIR